MAYAPDPTYDHPHAGWTVQNPRSAATTEAEQAPIKITGPVETTEDPEPRSRARRPRNRRA